MMNRKSGVSDNVLNRKTWVLFSLEIAVFFLLFTFLHWSLFVMSTDITADPVIMSPSEIAFAKWFFGWFSPILRAWDIFRLYLPWNIISLVSVLMFLFTLAVSRPGENGVRKEMLYFGRFAGGVFVFPFVWGLLGAVLFAGLWWPGWPNLFRRFEHLLWPAAGLSLVCLFFGSGGFRMVVRRIRQKRFLHKTTCFNCGAKLHTDDAHRLCVDCRALLLPREKATGNRVRNTCFNCGAKLHITDAHKLCVGCSALLLPRKTAGSQNK